MKYENKDDSYPPQVFLCKLDNKYINCLMFAAIWELIVIKVKLHHKRPKKMNLEEMFIQVIILNPFIADKVLYKDLL